MRDVDGPEEAQLQLASNLGDLEESVSGSANERDPDDAFSTVPYIKGMFLSSLYFSHFAGGLVSSQSMRDYFLEYLAGGNGP